MKASWLGVAMLVAISAPAASAPVYQTDFNSLTTAHTVPDPSLLGHDGWYNELPADDPGNPAFGEIQSTVAFSASGNALHEATFPDNGVGAQTIDIRLISPPDLSLTPIMTLSAPFQAGTVDLTSPLPYSAAPTVNGGPYPGFEILGFTLFSGNDAARSETASASAWAPCTGPCTGISSSTPRSSIRARSHGMMLSTRATRTAST